MLRRALLLLAALAAMLVAGAGVAIWLLSEGVTGRLEPRGRVTATPRPAATLAARAARQSAVPGARPGSQVLFGDLHVHTTYSADAFVFSLPLVQGEGAHPPADACDYARFCAGLDFWSINDHAEHLTPRQWSETKRSIRECNAVAGDPANPDLVAFLGWEWTQSSVQRPDEPHYGHKNVILLGTADDEVPTRPIGAGAGGLFHWNGQAPAWAWPLARAALVVVDSESRERALDFNRFLREVRGTPACDPELPVRALPDDCFESAPTPDQLFRKLDEWDVPALVIPHGTAWGIHAPAGSSFETQLTPGMHDASRQRLLEVYSGHGSSEVVRALPVARTDAAGARQCAPPSNGFTPCCWRAGELVRERCGDASGTECEARVEAARAAFLAGGDGAYDVVPGSTAAEWLECGQLAGPDAFLPAFQYRPRMSAQFALAARGPADGASGEPTAFRFGLIGSSDNHKARAGNGFKEGDREFIVDAWGVRADVAERFASAEARTPEPRVSRAPLAAARIGTERGASYYYTGGLVAAHAAGRDRRSIWDSLERREVYGTSGDRILLWFDLLNGPGPAVAPMGAEVRLRTSPRFRVRAVGAFEQRPGCPPDARARLSRERLEQLCRGECYHPGDRRKLIDRIEVVRIRPQITSHEDVTGLVDDPWRVFPCEPDASGCSVEFGDPEFEELDREVVYYVRALQGPSPAVNGDPVRCERDAAGRCLRARPCPAPGTRVGAPDDCLTPVQERAWSSPIFVRPARGGDGSS